MGQWGSLGAIQRGDANFGVQSDQGRHKVALQCALLHQRKVAAKCRCRAHM
jgi:hypothetical protein